jgi:hypothetical protein
LIGFPIKPLAHLFSTFEEGKGSLCDLDGGASARVTPRARSADLGRKHSETSQLNSISATQSFDHFVEYRVNDLLYVALKKVRVLRGNALYEFRFYHGRRLQMGAIFVKRIDHTVEVSLQICEWIPQLSHDLCGSAFLWYALIEMLSVSLQH